MEILPADTCFATAEGSVLGLSALVIPPQSFTKENPEWAVATEEYLRNQGLDNVVIPIPNEQAGGAVDRALFLTRGGEAGLANIFRAMGANEEQSRTRVQIDLLSDESLFRDPCNLLLGNLPNHRNNEPQRGV